jgi:hypothetical protein
MKKRLLSIVLTAVMLFSVTACGGGNSPGNPAPNIPVNPASDFEYRFDAELDGIAITKYIGSSVRVNIPSTIEDLPVVSVSRFSESGIMEVFIPNSVTIIGNSAFAYCEGLTNVVIPNSVTTIRGYAFAYCKGLTSIVIPDSVTTIGIAVFRDCTGLTNATFKGVTYSVGNNLIDEIDEWVQRYDLPQEFYDTINNVQRNNTPPINDNPFGTPQINDNPFGNPFPPIDEEPFPPIFDSANSPYIGREYYAWIWGTFYTPTNNTVEYMQFQDQKVSFTIGKPFTVSLDMGEGEIEFDVADFETYIFAIVTDLEDSAIDYHRSAHINSIIRDGVRINSSTLHAELGIGVIGPQVALVSRWDNAPITSIGEIGKFSKIEIELTIN